MEGVEDIVYKVVVENAKKLPDEDYDIIPFVENYNDVYVQIYGYGRIDIKVLQTKTADGTENPEWNDQTFVFKNNEGNGDYTEFKFKLYDDDTVLGQDIFGDDYLGTSEGFGTNEIIECDINYNKELRVARDGKECGTLYVTISKDC